jgi:hypothetical protein
LDSFAHKTRAVWKTLGKRTRLGHFSQPILGSSHPVWKCENCDHKEVAGSIKEIGEKAKKKGKIFVVRHGQGEHNVADIVSSDINDNVALTKIGKQQAEATGNLLKEKQVDVIFCSPLLRARQTAEILKQTSEIGAKNNI